MEYVIFDTNAYRYFVKDVDFEDIQDRVKMLKEKELQNGIQSLFSPIVAQELLAHCNKEDSAFDRCLKANKAMYLHTKYDNDVNNILPTFDVLLAKLFFDIEPERRIETTKAILQMSEQLALNSFDSVFQKLNTNLFELKKIVEDGEDGFASELEKMVRAFHPDGDNWRIFKDDKVKRQKLLEEIRSDNVSLSIAGAYLYTTIEICQRSNNNIQLSEPEFWEKAQSVKENFPEPIELFKNVFENMVNSDFDIRQNNRANFIWDIALMFNCGSKNFVNGGKLYFVTEDKAIIRTAVKNNSGCFVYSFNDYLKYLDIK